MNDNIHNGHRNRLREFAYNNNFKNMPEHQMLELLLSYVIPRKDTNPIAHKLIKEFGSFSAYLKEFWDGNIIYENDKTTSNLSDKISKDLSFRGMKFVGSTIIYSYLQAIGIINSHQKDCFLYKKN